MKDTNIQKAIPSISGKAFNLFCKTYEMKEVIGWLILQMYNSAY